MGDTNLYTLILQYQQQNLLSEVIETAGSLNYSCILAGNIYGLSHDGTKELKFSNMQSAQSHLFLEGGSIKFARDCESCENNQYLDFELHFEPRSSSLSFATTLHLYKKDWDRVETAFDLRRLWYILAKKSKALYGYATSNITFDTALSDPEIQAMWAQFETKVVYHSLPPVLFWANYFDWSYYENIDKTVFNEIPHRKFVMPEDYVCIYLAEFPWEEPQLATLKNLKYQLASSE